MRIYIVGGPGAGKTNLASALAHRLGAPHLDLDDLWDRLFERDAVGQITAAAHTFREELVAEYVDRNDWVIEGAEPPFLEAFAEASDLIVWCDVPFVVAAARISRRHVLADLRRRNRYPGYRRLFEFIRSVRRRYAVGDEGTDGQWTRWRRPHVAAAALRYEGKTLRLLRGSTERNLSAVMERVHSIKG